MILSLTIYRKTFFFVMLLNVCLPCRIYYSLEFRTIANKINGSEFCYQIIRKRAEKLSSTTLAD